MNTLMIVGAAWVCSSFNITNYPMMVNIVCICYLSRTLDTIIRGFSNYSLGYGRVMVTSVTQYHPTS
jgi:hypothetical protein